jgi:hypothetical protein
MALSCSKDEVLESLLFLLSCILYYLAYEFVYVESVVYNNLLLYE